MLLLKKDRFIYPYDKKELKFSIKRIACEIYWIVHFNVFVPFYNMNRLQRTVKNIQNPNSH